MADQKSYPDLVRDGLWNNNQSLVALLGLCPLLATTTSATNGLGMGLATTTVLTMSNLVVSMIRHLVRPEIRLPVFVIIIASFVTSVELAMHAWFSELYKVLGIFIPLIVVNCIIIGRAEAFASKNPVPRAVVDGLEQSGTPTVNGQTFLAGNALTLACDETAGAFDSVSLYWNRGAFPLEVYALAAYRMS